MNRKAARSAYVIGSGPNGLAAAICLARAGVKTTVLEAEQTFGGGLRSLELTLPGFTHDLCSAVHPMALTSPIFQSLPLAQYGLEWIHPPVPMAHPLDDGSAILLRRSVEETAVPLGVDASRYVRLLTPLVKQWTSLSADILRPLGLSRHPLSMMRFGSLAAWSAKLMAQMLFRSPEARALFAGLAAHSALPLTAPGSAAFGWVLAISAHAVGWPIARQGSQSIANALASYLESLGGQIVTGSRVRSLEELKDSSLILCDITPRQLLEISGDTLRPSYRRKLERYQYGCGAFKMDWALREPIPWKAEECRLAATVHVGGGMDDIVESEAAAWQQETSAKPFLLVVQPTLFDTTRAPQGKHTAWAYCHVPHGSTEDRTTFIEAQIERFAPGFQEQILARSVLPPAALEQYDANLIGGDINAGALTLKQLAWRPTRSLYRTPRKGLYLCSASTPPGSGVHGMCGYHAARAALADLAREW